MARTRDPEQFIESFGAVKKCFSAAAGQLYAEAGLGTLQAKLVRHIGRAGRISQADLARATDSDPTLIGRTLQTLIERDLVRRQRSDEDRREYVVELAPAGRRLRERLDKVRAQLAARVVEALDDRDLDDFDRIAGKVLAAFAGTA